MLLKKARVVVVVVVVEDKDGWAGDRILTNVVRAKLIEKDDHPTERRTSTQYPPCTTHGGRRAVVFCPESSNRFSTTCGCEWEPLKNDDRTLFMLSFVNCYRIRAVFLNACLDHIGHR